jgi:hypothetical protein
MPELSVYDLVMGTPEEALRQSEENFEHQCVKQLLRGFGLPTKQLSALERQQRQFTCDWFASEFPQFQVTLATCRVREYSLQELFERPAKNPVTQAFVECFGTSPEQLPCALLFKASGWTKLVMGRDLPWIDERRNYLNLSIYGRRYCVCPLEEFIDAYPSGRFLAPEAV